MSVVLMETSVVKLKNPSKDYCYALEAQTIKTSYTMTLPIMDKFSEKSLFYNFDPIQYKTGYKRANQFTGAGNTQMSLLLLEMFFLCKCVPKDQKDVVILYIGAVPGDHIKYLVKFFPTFIFHAYDPKEPEHWKFSDSDTLTRHFQRFDDTIAKEFLESVIPTSLRQSEKNIGKNVSQANNVCQGNVYLISDIRNESFNTNTSVISNSEILDRDMEMQLRWCQIIQPKYALLRFRPKHKYEGDSNCNVNNNYYEYPDGFLLKIPFVKKEKSTNTFLICGGTHSLGTEYRPTKKYYHQHIISLIEHHDSNVRMVNVYDNPLKAGLQEGFFGDNLVLPMLEKLNKPNAIPSKYACGIDFDHRMMYYIFSLYWHYCHCCLLRGTCPSSDCKYMGKSEKEISSLILESYIMMNEGNNLPTMDLSGSRLF